MYTSCYPVRNNISVVAAFSAVMTQHTFIAFHQVYT